MAQLRWRLTVMLAVAGCKSAPTTEEPKPLVVAPGDAAATTTVDALPPMTSPDPPPPGPTLHAAESWVLVRREDKLTPFGCTSTVDGKVEIHPASACVPLAGDALRVVDAGGKDIEVKRSSETVSCRAEGWDPFVNLTAFDVADKQTPAIAFYPQDRGPKPPIPKLNKRWTPTAAERKAVIEKYGRGTKLEPFAIANLDPDPELERLATVTVKHATAVGHGQTAGTMHAEQQLLLLDAGDGQLEVISFESDHPLRSYHVKIAAVTDFDGDGSFELWIEVDLDQGIWQVYEISGESRFDFAEDCKAG